MLKRAAALVSVVGIGMYSFLPTQQTETRLDNQKTPERYNQLIKAPPSLQKERKSLLTQQAPSLVASTMPHSSDELTFSYQELNHALYSFHKNQFNTLSESGKTILNEIPTRYTDDQWVVFYKNLGYKDIAIEQLLTLRAVQLGDLAQELEEYNSDILTVAPHQFLIEILKNKYEKLTRINNIEKDEAFFQLIQEVSGEYGIDLSLTEAYATFNIIETHSDTELLF
ncbi:hypothetical protein ACFFUP_14365 [Vibrio ostreicida]|uniref:Uncharacterized protein n=1 Tax=Vibrio ostreicida TaxID=526588 RepID=A0ABT8BW69_9VIBR|nr:hypothetical protein [Vibrio ostreicida]MDN3611417.1 hypothetical protein [Vibrio ostreicida]NPD08926.1 hypothetical protein [Vibrio ostreicida]